MELLGLSFSHKNTPLVLREKLSFSSDELSVALNSFNKHTKFQESFIFSTCNRTEIYCASKDYDYKNIIDWLIKYTGCDLDDRNIGYDLYQNADLVNHLFRVASGLDSMVLGDSQVLGQMKDAYNIALKQGNIGKKFDKLFQATFKVAKEVRTKTALGENSVSLPSVVYSIAEQELSYLKNKATVLILGAGDTSGKICNYLDNSLVGKLYIANRTELNAQKIIDRCSDNFKAEFIPLSKVKDVICKADVVFSAMSNSPNFIDQEEVDNNKDKFTKNCLYFDLSVPRTISTEFTKNNKFIKIFDLDVIQNIIAKNKKSREKSQDLAELIIDYNKDQYLEWFDSLDTLSALCSYREQAEQLCHDVSKKAQKLLASGEAPEDVLNYSLRLLRNKLLHHPTVNIRKAAKQGNIDNLELLKSIFQLSE
tara:strand:- start:12145 stop:13413 length:1269 start_codon:yes stop_codon:yes gene_type:complete